MVDDELLAPPVAADVEEEEGDGEEEEEDSQGDPQRHGHGHAGVGGDPDNPRFTALTYVVIWAPARNRQYR